MSPGHTLHPKLARKGKAFRGPSAGLSCREDLSPAPHAQPHNPTGPPWPRKHSLGEEVHHEVNEGVAAACWGRPGEASQLTPQGAGPCTCLEFIGYHENSPRTGHPVGLDVSRVLSWMSMRWVMWGPEVTQLPCEHCWYVNHTHRYPYWRARAHSVGRGCPRPATWQGGWGNATVRSPL